MKLRQQPTDFRVEELPAPPAGPAVGDFALYRLEKTGWTTPDAVRELGRRWQLDPRQVSFGGLKDRHAVTTQHVTVYRGPRRSLTLDRLTVVYQGQRPTPFTSADILANRFVVTLRGMTADAATVAGRAADEVAAAGLANYFDDQRFGSVGDPPEFVGRRLVAGDFDRALWLALAAPYEFDRADAQREKELLRALWGVWGNLKSALPPGHARDIVGHLADRPGDWKGAVARLRPELQGLYLAAYQSHVWNRVLAGWLTRTFAPADLGSVSLKLGAVPVPARVPDGLRERWEKLVIPLPSARLKADEVAGADWQSDLDAVLAVEGFPLSGMKVPGMRQPFFSKGERAACVRPANLGHAVADDELNPGRQKLTLSFDLPRGAYATMLVKRVAGFAPAELE